MLNNNPNFPTIIKSRKLIHAVYLQTSAMYLGSFILAYLISRIRPFKNPVNNFQLLAAFAIVASIIYLLLYCSQLPELEGCVKNNKKHNRLNSTGLAVAMPVLLGLMLAPIFLKFETSARGDFSGDYFVCIWRCH